MKMHMIAGIYQGNNRVGLRILDMDTGKTTDVSDTKVKGVLSLGMQIKNVEIKQGALAWSNGDIKRYPKINNGVLEGQSPIVILNQLGDQGYTVCDYNGKILKLSNKDVIGYAQKNGIANGKVSSRDGTEFISAIAGYYEYINIKQTSPTQSEVKKVESTPKPVEQTSIKKEVEQPVTQITKKMEPVTVDKTTEQSNPVSSSEQQIQGVKPAVSESNKQDTIKLSLNDKQLYALKRYYSTYNVNQDTANSEIAELNEAAAKNTMKKLCSKTTMLNEMLLRLNSTYKIARVYGNELGSIIVLFIDADLAMPKSLVLEISKVSLENIQVLYTELFGEFADAVSEVFKDSKDSFYMAARTYLKRIITRNMLGEYNNYETEQLVLEREFIGKYALCEKFSLPEVAALLGSIDLLSQWSSVLDSTLSGFDYRRDLSEYTDKMLRIGLKYSEESTGSGIKSMPSERDVICYLLESNELYNKKDDNSTGKYADAAKIPWEIEDEYLKSLGCTYITTPKTFKELTIGYYSTIDEVYDKLLVCLNIGENIFIDKFARFAREQAKLAKDLQRKKDAEELERIARRSIQQQQERKEKAARESNSHRTVATPESQNIDASGKTKIQLDIEAGADLSGYDPVELYNWLKDNTTQDNSTCFLIANDMLSRRLAYRDMSSRQKYRLDEAIQKMLKQYGYKGSSPKTDTKKQKSEDTEENNTYQLSEHSDIKSKVDLLIKKSNDTEMIAVLNAEPNVLKICYSILKYGRVSDRQLKHVNNAYSILENQ